MSQKSKALIREMRSELNQEIRAILNAKEETLKIYYGMMHYHMGWVDSELAPTENLSNGKQIRPLICLLTCAAAGGNWQQALPAAAAIEILHNFSLIHDDIEDMSDTRRGRNTVWKIWGIAQAINTGDAMFALAHLALSRLIQRQIEAEIVVKALQRFDETCVQLTQGQHTDMDFENRETVTVDEYIHMITGKTAALLSLSTELGALIAGCDDQTIEHYATYGLNLGLAFQVQDDILGIWGDESLTGKSAATDIVTKKKTLPVLYGLTKSQSLRQLYEQADMDKTVVTQVVQLLDDNCAHTFANQKAAYYSENATSHLEEAKPDGLAYLALQELNNKLLQRTF